MNEGEKGANKNSKKKRILIRVPTLIGNMCQTKMLLKFERIAKLQGNSDCSGDNIS